MVQGPDPPGHDLRSGDRMAHKNQRQLSAKMFLWTKWAGKYRGRDWLIHVHLQ